MIAWLPLLFPFPFVLFFFYNMGTSLAFFYPNPWYITLWIISIHFQTNQIMLCFVLILIHNPCCCKWCSILLSVWYLSLTTSCSVWLLINGIMRVSIDQRDLNIGHNKMVWSAMVEFIQCKWGWVSPDLPLSHMYYWGTHLESKVARPYLLVGRGGYGPSGRGSHTQNNDIIWK